MPDELPQRGQNLLGEQHDIVLRDEAHLHIQLSELGLAVGAEILVAVAPSNLVVPLDTADHQQLLEQLRALRQCVEAAGLQSGRHEEVASPLGRRTCQRRRFHLDEFVVSQDTAGGRVHMRTQSDGMARSFPPQVEVAVLEPSFLSRLVIELERQRSALREHFDVGGVDLDGARRDLVVLIAVGALLDGAGHLHHVLGAEPVRLLRDIAGAEYDLGDP